jgi:hypothetical protein
LIWRRLRSSGPLRTRAGFLARIFATKCLPNAGGAVFLSGNRAASEFRDGNREPAHDFHIISNSLILSMLSDYG